MNNTALFNFIDFYKNNNGELTYLTNSIISNFKITIDIVSPSTSNIECLANDEVLIDDYCIIYNKQQRILAKIKEKEQEPDSNIMKLTLITGLELINVAYRYDIPESKVVDLEDVAGQIQMAINNYNTEAGIILPVYCFSNIPITISKYIDIEELVSASTLLLDLIKTQNYAINIYYSQNKKINFECVAVNKERLNFELNNKTIFSSYNINYSSSDFNIIKSYDKSQNYKVEYYRLKKTGTIERLKDKSQNLSVVINADGSDGVDSTWNTNCIIPEKVNSKIETGNENSIESLKEISKAAYEELKDQFYNHEITAEFLIDNGKLDIANFNDLFAKEIYLYINTMEIKTTVTKVEYTGSSILNIKFGNARMALTDKLKKGLI